MFKLIHKILLRPKKSLAIFSFTVAIFAIIIGNLSFPSLASAASPKLTISGGNWLVGDIVTTTVSLDNPGSTVCAIRADLQFPKNLINVTALSPSPSFTTEALKTFSNLNGTISYSLGAAGCISSNADVFFITFEAKQSGSGDIKFNSLAVVSANSQGEPFIISGTTQNAHITITSSDTPLTPPANTTNPTESPTNPTTTPTNPTAVPSNPTATPTINRPNSPTPTLNRLIIKNPIRNTQPVKTVASKANPNQDWNLQTPNLTSAKFAPDAIKESSNKRSSGIIFNGTADPNLKINLSIDDLTSSVTADSTGNWEYTFKNWLSDGRHTFSAKSEKNGRFSGELLTTFALSSQNNGSISIGIKPTQKPISRLNEVISQNYLLLTFIIICWIILIVGFILLNRKYRANKKTSYKNIN